METKTGMRICVLGVRLWVWPPCVGKTLPPRPFPLIHGGFASFRVCLAPFATSEQVPPSFLVSALPLVKYRYFFGHSRVSPDLLLACWGI